MTLKPCPFCGAPINLANGSLFGWHKETCFFSWLDEHEVDMTQAEIHDAFIEAWNRRADNAADVRPVVRGRWIPVTERLPEESGQYLIYATENGITHISVAKYGRHFYLTGRMAYWKITHWMPLPEPPEEG